MLAGGFFRRPNEKHKFACPNTKEKKYTREKYGYALFSFYNGAFKKGGGVGIAPIGESREFLVHGKRVGGLLLQKLGEEGGG